MPAQNTDPAPLRMTQRAAASAAARANASVRAVINPRLSALRRSGRLSVMTTAGGSDSYSTRVSGMTYSFRAQHRCDIFRWLNGHLEQGQCQGLALRVNAQGLAGAAGQHVVKHKVKRQEIRRFVAYNARRSEGGEVGAHTVGRQVLAQPGVSRRRVGDDCDIGVIALVATAAVGDLTEANRTHDVAS